VPSTDQRSSEIASPPGVDACAPCAPAGGFDRRVQAACSDGDLVQRIACGEREALGLLYVRHARAMAQVGMRIVGKHSEVEDVLHDVFLEVWNRAGCYDSSRGSVRTWLLVRMRSRCIDRTRVTRPPSVDRERADVVEMHFEHHTEAVRLRALVRGLPTPQRLVMELGYFDGLSHAEIAAELAVPVGTVKSRLSTALTALRTALGVPRKQEVRPHGRRMATRSQ
jgi:RNA polymerase sigma-70 factor (ECF subfamily)